jgi:hypothetical protein
VCCDYPSRGRNGYTSATPRDRVPRHVARLVVDYFAYAVRPGASAHRTTRRADHHTAHRAARHRLLRLRHASGCLGSSRGSSRRTSSTTSPTLRVWVPRHVARLVIDYFAYTARLGASARRAACRAARRRLLRLRRASGCLGTSRGTSRSSSRGLSRCSSLTTSTTPRVRVPPHVA